MRVLLLGQAPPCDLGYTVAQAPPYDGALIGSLTLGQALHFSCEEVLCLLAEGKPVICYTPGFPQAPKNRALAATLASRKREMKSWGIVFTDGEQRKLVTAELAQLLRQQGKRPAPGAVLTPLAKEILEMDGGTR